MAPPPIASSKPGACASGGGNVGDDATRSYFPRKAGDYCIDPHGDTRSYGEQAQGPLDRACTELFDGECEVYKGFGLDRVVTLRYIDGAGSPGAVGVNLSRFATRKGAYAFFTKRVTADADPVVTAPEVLEAGAAAALGSGIAYVYKEKYVLELSYTNELESPEQLRSSSKRALPGLATEVGRLLPGSSELPDGVSALPVENRVRLGVNYEFRDVLGASGAGDGAVGFYQRGPQRWRVFVAVRGDDAAAKDTFETLGKLDGAKSLKGTAFDTLRLSQVTPEGHKLTWLVGRSGPRVVGIGDEEFVTSDGDSAKLSEADKLRSLSDVVLDKPPGAAPAPSAG